MIFVTYSFLYAIALEAFGRVSGVGYTITIANSYGRKAKGLHQAVPARP